MASDGNFFKDMNPVGKNGFLNTAHPVGGEGNKKKQKESIEKSTAQLLDDSKTAADAEKKNTDIIDNMDIDSDLYNPNYNYSVSGDKYKNKQDALTLLFNQRKAELAARTRAPGIAQTRYN